MKRYIISTVLFTVLCCILLNGYAAIPTDYYPFGATHGNALNPCRQPYKFGGKELNEMHGLNQYDFHARRMSRDIPRFTTIDPLAEKYYNISPYAYCVNNPVRFVDPTGMWIIDENKNLVAEKGDNAWTFAKYLNTDAKTAIEMLNEQEYTVNKKGILNLKIGDVFQVEHTINAPDSRDDLGFMGNKIRERAGSEFSKNLFENYWTGGGNIELSGKRFAGILMYIKDNVPEAKNPQVITLSNGTQGIQRIVNFYSSTEYDKSFGRATVYYNKQENIVGFYDYYDFDSKPWGERSTKNEFITRAVKFVSPQNATPFSIKYGQSEK
jgi:RHS repeat-associated protein